MPGLRRLTMCHNEIGDRAAALFAERLKDDRWLRCLDLQQCNLTSTSAVCFIESLRGGNKSLVIVDLRKNEFIEPQLLKELGKLLSRNQNNALADPLQLSWQWIGDKSPHGLGMVNENCGEESLLNTSVRAYTCCKPQPNRRIVHRRARSCSVRRHGREIASLPNPPWNYRPLLPRNRVEHVDRNDEVTLKVRHRSSSPRQRLCFQNQIEEQRSALLNHQVEELRKMLHDEVCARRRVEQKLQALELENGRLMAQILKGASSNESSVSDEALYQVEQAVAQFHQFLDFLRKKG